MNWYESRTNEPSLVNRTMMTRLLAATVLFFVPGNAQLFAQLQLTPFSGWKAFVVLDQGEDISAIVDAVYGNVATRRSKLREMFSDLLNRKAVSCARIFPGIRKGSFCFSHGRLRSIT